MRASADNGSRRGEDPQSGSAALIHWSARTSNSTGAEWRTSTSRLAPVDKIRSAVCRQAEGG
jgi:hypothetical protein